MLLPERRSGRLLHQYAAPFEQNEGAGRRNAIFLGLLLNSSYERRKRIGVPGFANRDNTFLDGSAGRSILVERVGAKEQLENANGRRLVER